MAEKATSSLTLASLLEHGAARDGVAHGVIGCESEVCARSMEWCWLLLAKITKPTAIKKKEGKKTP